MPQAPAPTGRAHLRQGHLVSRPIRPLHHRRPSLLDLPRYFNFSIKIVLKKSIKISAKSWILFFFCEFSFRRGGERARGPVGPAGSGVRGAGRAVLRVSAARIGLPVRRCRRRPQKGLCLLLTMQKFITFYSSVWHFGCWENYGKYL